MDTHNPFEVPEGQTQPAMTKDSVFQACIICGFVNIQSQSDFQTWMAEQEKELATENAR